MWCGQIINGLGVGLIKVMINGDDKYWSLNNDDRLINIGEIKQQR